MNFIVKDCFRLEAEGAVVGIRRPLAFAYRIVFIDQTKIYVKAGDGGNGCVSFRREKYVPRGGPNGGDGGNGGDVLLRATGRLATLLDLKYQQHYIAQRAAHGQGKNRSGRNSPDLVIEVPLGTVVRDIQSMEVLGDLVDEGQTLRVARGGRGGRGNARFATPTRQAPTHAEPGGKGEERWLLVELKLMADVALVGLPNAGKSTLLSRVSSAHPKVADYPFTTLAPHLGTVRGEGDEGFVMADIPGLIEGAHEGRGLGIRFLRHIERTRVLAFLVDVAEGESEDPVAQLQMLRREVKSFHPVIAQKPWVVVGTKTDIKGAGARYRRLQEYCRRSDITLFGVSSVTGEGVREFITHLGRRVEEIRRMAACVKP